MNTLKEEVYIVNIPNFDAYVAVLYTLEQMGEVVHYSIGMTLKSYLEWPIIGRDDGDSFSGWKQGDGVNEIQCVDFLRDYRSYSTTKEDWRENLSNQFNEKLKQC